MNVELKPQRFSKIFSTAWLWKIFMWPLEFSFLLLHSNLYWKAGIQFSAKKFLPKCFFQTILRSEIDSTTSYFLICSKTAFPYRYILELHIFEYGCLVGLNMKEGTRQRQEALMSNHCLINHRWYDVEKITVPGSSNLKAQHTVLC